MVANVSVVSGNGAHTLTPKVLKTKACKRVSGVNKLLPFLFLLRSNPCLQRLHAYNPFLGGDANATAPRAPLTDGEVFSPSVHALGGLS